MSLAVSPIGRPLFSGAPEASALFGLGVDRHAIGAARQNAIFYLVIGIDFARQDPADKKQQHDNPQRDQGPALAVISFRRALP
jgi:hypothetical protein